MSKPTLPTICSGFVILLCLVVLIGWQFDLPLLRRLLPNAPQTTPLTVIMLLTLSLALLTVERISHNDRLVWVSRGLVGLALVVAVWTGMQYLFRFQPNIESILYPRLVRAQGGSFPGRPSPHTVISCLLLGTAIGLRSWPAPLRRLASLPALVGIIIPWLALFGYASLTNPFYALPNNPQTGMSPLTALSFLALSLGVIGLRQGQGIIALLTDPSVGGQLVRRLLPITIFVPLLIGWLVIHGGNAGWFEPALGVAFSWGLLSLCLAGLILHQGLILYRHDHQQQHAAQDRERLLAELQQTIARLDQANMDLKQQSVALEQANTTLQQFARIASHDLQEPLLSIGEFVKLLQETYHGQLDEQADDWIERTVESVTWMQSMIRGLLTYARLDSQARPFEPISLGAIVQQVTEVLAATMVDTQAQLICDELPTVLGDQTQLIQLMLNLISNSLTFRTDQPPRIHLSAERQPTEWVIAVRDNGIGIAPRHQERIFEVFQRLHARHKYPGAGLGLAISRRVVERHGGRIWVESDVGQGSTFYFTMPLMSGDQAAS